MCPSCQHENSHAPNCIIGDTDPKYQLELLLKNVEYSRYGTKHRAELIMRLEDVIKLLP